MNEINTAYQKPGLNYCKFCGVIMDDDPGSEESKTKGKCKWCYKRHCDKMKDTQSG